MVPPNVCVTQSLTGYFGNEASRTTFYAAAAIVFVVPPANSAGRRALIANAPRGFGTPPAATEGGIGKPPFPKGKKTGKETAEEKDGEEGQSSEGTGKNRTLLKASREVK